MGNCWSLIKGTVRFQVDTWCHSFLQLHVYPTTDYILSNPKLLFFFLQGTPPGISELVVPSLDKIDLTRLKADIPKYHSTGAIDKGTLAFWKEFLENFEQLYGMVHDNPE